MAKEDTQFKPGERSVGRAVGTPNKATAEVKALAREYGPAAIVKLAALAGLVFGDDGKPAGMAEAETAQVAANKEILDRAYGKSRQPVVGGDDDDEPVKLVARIELVGVRADDDSQA